MEFPSPIPKSPDGPIAYKLWMIWKPLPKGSDQGFIKDIILARRYGAIIIKPTIPISPKIPHLIKNESLAPDINIIIIKVMIITIPWPKSGSSMIKPKNKNIIPRMGNKPLTTFFTSASLLAKYLDTKIIRANLANSEGYILNELIPNQDLEPLRTIPIPGISTSISNVKDINSILLACL